MERGRYECIPHVSLSSDPLIVGTSTVLTVHYPPLLPRLTHGM